jgi:hypothetical protein
VSILRVVPRVPPVAVANGVRLITKRRVLPFVPLMRLLPIIGYRFDSDDLASFPGDTGRRTLEVFDDSTGRSVGFAVLSWYRMDSGYYEFTGYLA